MNEWYTNQALDYLGIVAGVCQQIGLIEHTMRVCRRRGAPAG
jgi:hypothetical protein